MEIRYFARIFILVLAIVLLQINLLHFSQPELFVPDIYAKEYYQYFSKYPEKLYAPYKEMLNDFLNYIMQYKLYNNQQLIINCVYNLNKIFYYSYIKTILQYVTIVCYFSLLYNIFRLEYANYLELSVFLDENEDIPPITSVSSGKFFQR